ncbi:MAG: hypothetical protein ACRD3B_14395 [Candidatus Sulfotelmatobacter sp.]
MPLCIEEHETTTASHRPQLWLPAFLLVQSIASVGLVSGETDEPIPTEDTVNAAIDLITDVPFDLLGNPDISPFYGEIHLTWTSGQKQIVLMFFPNRAPLVQHYSRIPNANSIHDIEDASADRLAHWLRWLRA